MRWLYFVAFAPAVLWACLMGCVSSSTEQSVGGGGAGDPITLAIVPPSYSVLSNGTYALRIDPGGVVSNATGRNAYILDRRAWLMLTEDLADDE